MIVLCSACSFFAVPLLCADCSFHQVFFVSSFLFSDCSLQWLLMSMLWKLPNMEIETSKFPFDEFCEILSSAGKRCISNKFNQTTWDAAKSIKISLRKEESWDDFQISKVPQLQIIHFRLGFSIINYKPSIFSISYQEKNSDASSFAMEAMVQLLRCFTELQKMADLSSSQTATFCKRVSSIWYQ